ncbi:MAG TPA: hypothetical protein VEL76_41195, partial [Gemmataceae bacterium]|nr:hypothetical protein [Gemmataceae bacterium]
MSQYTSRKSSILVALLSVLVVLGLRSEAQEPNLETLWADLADQDAAKAYRAIWALALTPEKTVPFLKARLSPVSGDRQQIDQLVRDLDKKAFAVREKAMAELGRLSDAAEAALKQVLQEKPSVEMSRRIEQLLARIPEAAGTPALVRQARALEVLERAGTPEARELLERLAKGNAAARWTQMAQAAHARLASRPRPAPVPVPPKLDHFGDPLPAGSLARLGTVRLQNSDEAALAPDGKTLVTVADKVLHLWDITTGRELPGFPQSKDWRHPRAVAISPNGKLLAVAYHRGAYHFVICELPSGKLLYQQRNAGPHVEPCHYAPAFSADSKTFVIGNQVTTQVWDMTTGKKLREFFHGQGTLSTVAVSPDGRRLVTSTHRRQSRIWDVATGKVLQDLGEQTLSYRAAFSHDSTQLATSGPGASVRILDMATGKLKREIALAADPARSEQAAWAFAFSPDGTTLALTTRTGKESPEQQIQLWNLADANAKPRVLVPPPGVGWIDSFSQDGQTLLWRTWHSVRLLDATTGKDRHGWPYRGDILAVAWSPDGALIATGCQDGSVSLWDAATAKLLRTMLGHRGRSGSLVFSPDSKSLVMCGAWDEPATLWDTVTGAKRAVLDNNARHGVRWAASSPDGKLIFTGGHSSKRGIFETATGKLLREFTLEHGGGAPAAFSPDTWFMASGRGEAVCVHDLVNGKLRYLFETKGQCSGLAFSPDGRTLAAQVSLDDVILWELLTGRERARFPMPKETWYSGCL